MTPRRLALITLAAGALALTAAVTPTAAVAAGTPSYGVTWTVDSTANSLTEYAAGVHGAATPIVTIHGSSTDLDDPTGVAVDPSGDVFAANAGSSSITEYAVGAAGDAPPVTTIAGAKTALDQPASLSYSNDELWVTDPSDNLVEAFSAGVAGNVLPALTFGGAKTRLDHPVAVSAGAFDISVWVVNAPAVGTPSLVEFDTQRPGNTAPDTRIAGSRTGLVQPDAVVAEGDDDVWVADRATNTLSSFDDFGGPANETPGTVIRGPNTGLDGPTGLSLTALDQLCVSNAGNHSVRVFRAGARFDASPLRSITAVGSAAGTPDAVEVVSGPPGPVTDVHAVATSGKAVVSWKAPARTGGGVLGYLVLASQDTGADAIYSFATTGTFPYTTKQTHYTLRGLTNGVEVSFLVLSVNTQGQTFTTDQPSATPFGNPGAPRGVTAARGDGGSVQVFWARPAHSGGKPVTHYRVQYARCSPGATGCHYATRVVSGSARDATMTGLHSGARYAVRVRAVTSHGVGTPSRVAHATAG